jgi:hypothetical protein
MSYLFKANITDTINRYFVPTTANEYNRRLVKGQTIKVYSIVDNGHIIGDKKLFIMTFKINNNKTLKTWLVSVEELKHNKQIIKSNLEKFLWKSEN